MSLISNNLKYLRRINGLTQDQFARRIGTKRANVGAYEEARAVPPVDTLKIIANTFGISVDDFVKKDIRKLRETPDLTFGFDSKPTYSEDAPESEDDPFDFPPSIGDLMNKFLGDEPPLQEKNTEMIAQKVMLKPTDKVQFESDPFISNTQPKINQIKEYTETSPKHIFDNPSNKVPSQTAYIEPVSKNIPDSHSYKNTIQIVRRFQYNDYLIKNKESGFLKTLIEFHLPTLPIGEYRAFEATEDFTFEGALLIGSRVNNWYDIIDSKNYVLVTKPQGIIYRRVYNQVKIKGTLLLSSDNHRFPSTEISINDVIETWEIKAFLSYQLPEPSPSFDKLSHLVGEMKFELERLKK
ncbi:helix-turn-helix transcriptional regulator [Emticicia sp. BO119]|uniref:helix-turn-helix domain-containing protein n=1 Tax=Emticicia sp. BO119 TaxID=2757768 RepID=UPI0015F1218B|nr:helix-turn-helix transcriptional regulator [Emticicia sp. BO119]MBA4853524.1 helix-turn-helix transcriptional regulator [Emticicia sp. BO119]